MTELVLDVRLDGYAEPIGTLARDRHGAHAFAYMRRYSQGEGSIPLSLSMPLQDQPFEDSITRAFFDNLLQERDDVLRRIMDEHGISRSDIASLLLHMGKDCAGAVSVLPPGALPQKHPGILSRDYVRLTPKKVNEIVRSLHINRRLPNDTNDPSPLSGVQSKVALTVLNAEGEYAMPAPGSGAPTTHFLKVPDQDHPLDVVLEESAMTLAGKMGMVTAATRATSFDGIGALLVERFDRTVDEHGYVRRVHQEDFAQALGLPPRLKYQRYGNEERKFDVLGVRRILDQTADPAASRDAFIRAVIFDLFIGNTDAHAKNHAVLFRPDGRPILAPRYDILPCRLDHNLSDELAFSIGKAKRLEDIDGTCLQSFLSDLGITGSGAARRVIAHTILPMANELTGCLTALDRGRLKRFGDLIAHNIQILLESMDIPVPDAALQRDAFIERAGGWS